MKWAHVSFVLDKIKCNVPLSFFQNQGEISVNKNYYVFWSSDPTLTPEDVLKKEGKILYVDKVKKSNRKTALSGWYMATVLLIADSEDELVSLLEMKRLRTATLVDNGEKDEQPTLDKKHFQSEAQMQNMKNLAKKIKRSRDLLELDNSDEDDATYVTRNEIDLMRKQISDLELLNKQLQKTNACYKNKLDDLEKKNVELEEEIMKEKVKNEKISSLNLAYQEKMLLGSYNPPNKPRELENCKESSKEMTVADESFLQTERDDEIEINSVVEKYITKDVYEKIKRSAKPGKDGDAIFVKNLASALWSAEELRERSSQGIACPTKKGELARPECTPEKKEFIRLLLKKRIELGGSSNGETESRVKKMNSYLSSKITTVRRDFKNKNK